MKKSNLRRPAFEYKLISKSEDLFLSIFDKTPVAIIILSAVRCEVIEANQAALSLLKEKNVATLSQHHPHLFSQFTEKNFDGKDFLQRELRLRRMQGGIIYITAKACKLEKSRIILTLEDITQHKNENKKLLKMAQLDGLTGILNHKTLVQRFKEELSRAKRYHLPLSCFMFDIDDFKGFNDRFGHVKGDELLKKTAKALKGQMRETDIIGRYGGDEFLVILPETPMSEAWIPAKRVHTFFWENPLVNKKLDFKATFSIGISGFPLKGLDTVKDIIDHADKGLYESKTKGGNQIIFRPHELV